MIEMKMDEDSPRSDSRRTDDSLPISTLVTLAIYHDSDDSRVQIYSSDPGTKINKKSSYHWRKK